MRVTPRAVISPVSTGWPQRGLHEGLGGQVVHLVGRLLPQDVDQRHLVEQVAGHEGDAVLEVGDALEVDRRGAPDHADDLVALVEQELGQVGAVLAGDAGDEGSLGHDVKCSWALCMSVVGRVTGFGGGLASRRAGR